MTGYAITTDHGNDCRFGAGVVGSGHGEEQTSGGIVTGVTGIMNLVVAGAERDTGGCAGRGRMTARAF